MPDHADSSLSLDGPVHGPFLLRVWRLITPYWHSEEKRTAWLLLLVVITLSLFNVGMSVLLNIWNRYFYDALQNRDLAAFLRLMLYFCGVAAIFIFVAVYRLYLTQMLTIRWRRWLTKRHFALWLGHKNYYRLEQAGSTDNPDQRLSDDLNSFTDSTLSLGLGFLTNVVSLVSFSVILWKISGSIAIGGHNFPHYMFWGALIYSIIGTWLTHLIGRRLILLNNRQQRYEADLRFGLVRVREKAESIALYGGESNEQQRLMGRFGKVWGNFWQLMRYQKRLTFFTVGYAQISDVAGFLLAAPRYFAGTIQLGNLTQINSAFGNVQGSFSWFVDAYTDIVLWRATSDRILDFRTAMAAVQKGGSGIEQRVGGDALVLDRLSLRVGDRPLLNPVSLAIQAREHVLVSGPSGAGKSTLLRAMAGIWRFGDGSITLPAARVLFLPQLPYLPIGTLRAALSYPQTHVDYPRETVDQVLQACRLEHLKDRLDEAQHWERRLSPGEQQRLAIARALLFKPEWLFLDEATSAVAEDDEALLYTQLLDRLPGVTLVSVGHRQSLVRFHDRRLWLDHGTMRDTVAETS